MYLEVAQDYLAEMYPLLSYSHPTDAEIPPGGIIGTWAISVPHKIRFILAPDMELAPGVLPGDLTRAWIRTEYNLPIRRRKAQLAHNYNVPLHARVGLWGDCSYIDIRAAYLQVLSMGYDVEYLAGKYIGAAPIQVPDEIAKHKLCYSMAISSAASPLSSFEIMGHNGRFEHKPMNMFSNPSLYNLAQDTLNGIGAEIISVLGENCVYSHTDGFIVKAGFEQQTVDIINDWGFKARVKYAGETEVRGVASYKVGNQVTERFDKPALDYTSKLMPLEESAWLKKRWSMWSGKLRIRENR